MVQTKTTTKSIAVGGYRAKSDSYRTKYSQRIKKQIKNKNNQSKTILKQNNYEKNQFTF
jgi:hypothetical protein